MNTPTALTILFGILVLLVPASSHACWDGAMVHTERVTLATSSYGDEWDRRFTRQAAAWTARLEALLPDDVNLTVDHGWIEAWGAGGNEEWGRREAQARWEERSLPRLFDLVADLVEAEPETRRRALTIDRRPVTIQLAATRNAAFAQRLARLARNHLRDEQVDLAGFIEFGGFPAWNDAVFITSTAGRNGGRVYQVVLGAYVDQENARLALAQVRLATGLDGFLRNL